jgi:hypothetical protein
MHSGLVRALLGIIILCTFGALGIVMASIPHKVNEIRIKFPGQGESPDWLIRIFGVLIAGFSIACAVLVIFVSK